MAPTRTRRCGGLELVLGTLVGAVLLGGCTSSQSDDGPLVPANVGSCDVTAVVAKVMPSVVTIAASDGTAGTTGSGEIIRESGEILTNNHVIAAAAVAGGQISVLFSDGTTAPAAIVGRDPQTDLAVIRVDTGKPLPAIAMGASSTVEIGQPVVALGAPLGLAGTVTSGIVSALGRTVQVPGDNGPTAVLLSAVQTDAAINPGNSGGALTDCSGSLIGVPSAIATVSGESGSAGLGFAIPVDLARVVSDQLIATGTVTHSYLGLEVIEIPASASGDPTQPGGVYVSVVVPGGPAAVAGLLAGDVITAVDSEVVADADQLALLTLTRAPGETATVTFQRAGATSEVVLTFGTPPGT